MAIGHIQGSLGNIDADKPSGFHSFRSLSENATADCIERLIPLLSLMLIILTGPISIQKHEGTHSGDKACLLGGPLVHHSCFRFFLS